MRQFQTKTLKTLLLIVLTATSVGCGCLPKPPEIHARQILQNRNRCDDYKLIFGETELSFQKVGTMPLDQCLVDGYFVLSDTELVNARAYYHDAKKCANSQECKAKEVK